MPDDDKPTGIKVVNHILLLCSILSLFEVFGGFALGLSGNTNGWIFMGIGLYVIFFSLAVEYLLHKNNHSIID